MGWGFLGSPQDPRPASCGTRGGRRGRVASSCDARRWPKQEHAGAPGTRRSTSLQGMPSGRSLLYHISVFIHPTTSRLPEQFPGLVWKLPGLSVGPKRIPFCRSVAPARACENRGSCVPPGTGRAAGRWEKTGGKHLCGWCMVRERQAAWAEEPLLNPTELRIPSAG